MEHAPIGRKPLDADDQAEPPEPGPLPAAAPGQTAAGVPTCAPVQNQGAVIPWPNPPGTANQPGAERCSAGSKCCPSSGSAAPAPAAAVATPSTSIVGWVDGPRSPNNTLQNFGISGADLGIMWDNGDPSNDQVLIAFGDTFGNLNVPGQQWRLNTMFRSSDRSLGNGIDVPLGVVGDKYSGSPEDQQNFSKQIINSLNLVPTEASVIPTAGISVGTTQYVNFMSVKQWGNPGRWTTNFSAIAASTDNGQNWTVNRATIRPAAKSSVPGVAYVAGNQNFQQGAFVRPGDGYVYSFGTPSGRGGSAYVSRVPEGSVQDLTQYEYWSQPWWKFFGGGSWVRNNPSAATAGYLGPGERNVGPVQHLSQEIRRALLQRFQQRRDAHRGGSAGAVELGADAREVNPGSRRHLRAVPPPLVGG